MQIFHLIHPSITTQNPSLLTRITSFLAARDWTAIIALAVAIWSLYVGRKALDVGKKTLENDEESWNQQKWFDLYAKADEAYDLLDWYCTVYQNSPNPQTPRQASDWNNLMYQIKRAHSMAMVFPKHDAINNLLQATGTFSNPADAFLPWRNPMLFDAVEDLRELAFLDPSILKKRKRTNQ
ncbi:MAG: hypothetical protein WA618_02655 [Terriglobales bacterium]